MLVRTFRTRHRRLLGLATCSYQWLGTAARPCVRAFSFAPPVRASCSGHLRGPPGQVNGPGHLPVPFARTPCLHHPLGLFDQRNGLPTPLAHTNCSRHLAKPMAVAMPGHLLESFAGIASSRHLTGLVGQANGPATCMAVCSGRPPARINGADRVLGRGRSCAVRNMLYDRALRHRNQSI